MKPTKLRCAIYTRKSTEEGLDQAFNSLHAQREACEAYVASQIGEGWVVLPTLYDDGGISGGTMERPALQQLLKDVDRGLIDVVVVYKVDRLTRALADFAKIVERFDARSVSFVSVTQAFNTTNSMGRLTLNVLLSFAQFEREVTGERIRDKIAASKKKGMWMGGNLPFGYGAPIDPVSRALVVSPAEAEQVRGFFERYLELGSVHLLQAELLKADVRTPIRTLANGAERGGKVWSRGALFHLLRNRVYLGEIPHKEKSYPGNHPAIVDAALFDAVQRALDDNRARVKARPLRPEGSPLCGKLFDADGVAMTPTCAYGKLGRRYRYYVSQPLQLGQSQAILGRDVVRRVAAGPLEGVVMQQLTDCQLLKPGAGWAEIREVVQRIDLKTDRMVFRLALPEVSDAQLAAAQQRLKSGQALKRLSGREPRLELVMLGRPVFSGGRTWVASPDGRSLASSAAPDAALIGALKRSHAIVSEHGLSPQSSLEENRQGRSVADAYHRALARLAFLAPDIQAAILEGTQPASLSLERLIKKPIPIAWSDQRKALGFAAVP